MVSNIDTDPFLATHPLAAERQALQASLVQVKNEIEALQAVPPFVATSGDQGAQITGGKWKMTAGVTGVPIANGWEGLYLNFTAGGLTLTPAAGTCRMLQTNVSAPYGVILPSNGGAVVMGDGTDLIVMGDVQPVPYSANPVRFEGTAAYLRRDADLTGVVDGQVFTGSFWFRRTLDAAIRITGSPADGFNLSYQTTTDAMVLYAENAGQTVILNSIFLLPYDTLWHHWLLSFNLAFPSQRWSYIDDLPVSGSWTTYNSAEMIDLTRGNRGIGAKSDGSGKWNGDLSDIWMRFGGAVIDFSVEANRRMFITAVGAPADPVGWPTGGQVALYGATAAWHTNKGSGGGFTKLGVLTDGTGPVEVA